MLCETDREVFLNAVERVKAQPLLEASIGTYNEKTIHRVLKYFFETDEAYHEVKLGDFVADVKCDNRIFEIQTAGFHAIKNRLDFFLQSNEVTVVYPVIGRKYLVWIDPETGDGTLPKLINKKGKAVSVLPELYRLGELFNSPYLTVKCIILEVTEYRLRDGWGRGGKRGAHRIDCIPSDILDIETVCGTDDLRRLIPFGKSEEFSAKEFARACGFSHKSTRVISMSLKFLKQSGVIESCSKAGNAVIYRLT